MFDSNATIAKARRLVAERIGVVHRPTAPDIAEMVREVYALPEHGAGGCLHCALDDGNVEDVFIALAVLDEHKCDVCASLSLVLMRASWTQRNKAIDLARRARRASR